MEANGQLVVSLFITFCNRNQLIHSNLGQIEISSSFKLNFIFQLNKCISGFHNLRHDDMHEVLDFVNNIPDPCPRDMREKIDKGDTIVMSNHCCVFEDFNVTTKAGDMRTSGTRISLEDLFGKEKNKNEEIYSLQSFLQSWKYLKLAPEITEIQLNQEIVSSAKKYLENIVPNEKRVAIHMRVLDASGPKEIFNFPGPEYFQKALQHFYEKWTNVKFLIFCDKPSWCREQSIFDSKDVYVMDKVWKETSIKKKAHQANMHRFS